jgi:hypothetical protein
MTEKSYFSNFLNTRTSKEYEDNLVMPDHKAGIYGVYYSPLEITFAEKEIKRDKLIANQSYYIDYFKSLAKKNPKVIKPVTPLNEHDRDSVAATWANEQYRIMWDRYK